MKYIVALIMILFFGEANSQVLNDTLPSNIIDEAKKILASDVERDLPLLVVDKYTVSLECLKLRLKNALEEYGLQIKQPLFDDENRLETFETDLRDVIFPERNFTERIAIAAWISERDEENEYRLYLSAYGKFRRRLNDVKQSEEIPKKELERFESRILYRMDIEKCKQDVFKIELNWTPYADWDLSIIPPHKDTCNWINRTIKEGKMVEDDTNGKGSEVFILQSKKESEYIINVEYYKIKSENPTISGTLAISKKDNILKEYNLVLSRKQEVWSKKIYIKKEEGTEQLKIVD